MADDTARTEARELVTERVDRLLTEHPPGDVEDKEFWGAQYDLGLAWVQFPEGLGGLGVPPGLQHLVDERLRDAGANFVNRRINTIGVGMGAPTILEHGTREDAERYLRPMFILDEVWCQLFSEPGAGSDLAGLATSAVREGDQWIVNGQKVWTTVAHIAKWGLLVARTDPDVPKHAGLTYFIVDMESDGVEVRPLYQITGEAEFNEVYFDDAHIPDDQRLGEVGQGWSIAMTTLMNERVAIGSGSSPREGGTIGMAVDAWREHDHDDPGLRDELVQLWIEAEALRLTGQRAAEMRKAGTPGPEGSTAKLQWAELNKKVTSFAMDLLGTDALRYPEGYEMSRPSNVGLRNMSLQKNFLRARANSIEGGTSEIMKNILGERVLGLPGEPRVDKDIPWKEVPRD